MYCPSFKSNYDRQTLIFNFSDFFGLGYYQSQIGVGVDVLLNYMGQVSKVELKS